MLVMQCVPMALEKADFSHQAMPIWLMCRLRLLAQVHPIFQAASLSTASGAAETLEYPGHWAWESLLFSLSLFSGQ